MNREPVPSRVETVQKKTLERDTQAPPPSHLPRLGISLHRSPTVYNSLKCESLFIIEL